METEYEIAVEIFSTARKLILKKTKTHSIDAIIPGVKYRLYKFKLTGE